jgi:hypothetical protein
MFTAGVIDTGGRFATGCKFADGVVDTGVPCAAGVLVVHLDLQISPRIFGNKFKMALMLFLGAWVKIIYEKT